MHTPSHVTGPILRKHTVRQRRGGTRETAPKTVRQICETTGGHPFYTQHLCHVIWELTEPNREVPEEMLSTALDTLLERESYAYTVLWESLGVNQQRFLTGLANEPRGTQVYSAQFVRSYRLRSPASAQRVVKALLERDVIDHDNGSFVITDRFFGIWIRQLGSLT